MSDASVLTILSAFGSIRCKHGKELSIFYLLDNFLYTHLSMEEEIVSTYPAMVYKVDLNWDKNLEHS